MIVNAKFANPDCLQTRTVAMKRVVVVKILSTAAGAKDQNSLTCQLTLHHDDASLVLILK